VIVDAVKTDRGTPGDIYRLTPEDIPTLHTLSPHDADLRTAIEYGKRFIGEMPTIDIYGIEAENVTEYGETLSPKVEESLPKLIEKIKADLNKNGPKGRTKT